MGNITFEGNSPYVLPTLQKSEVVGGQATVLATLTVLREEQELVPLLLHMRADQALKLAEQLKKAANVSLSS